MAETIASAAAMLDRETERKLYQTFRRFFVQAERERRWDLWNDIPWDQASSHASETLVEAVVAAYAEEAFLPDYSQRLLNLLRSSRGRAWFVTRWSYEEGKHLLALGEWLVRANKRTDDQMKAFTDDLLAETVRDVPIREPVPALVWALAHEQGEIARYRALGAQARDENDAALTAVCDRLLRDEEAHAAFFRDTLRLIQEREPGLVADAVRRMILLPEMQPMAAYLRAELGVV